MAHVMIQWTVSIVIALVGTQAVFAKQVQTNPSCYIRYVFLTSFDFTETTQCDLNPCQNNGTCHDTVDSAVALVGTRAVFAKQVQTNPSCYTLCISDRTETTQCNLNPCQNNGTCHNTMGSFYCSCSAHYTGSFCETSPDKFCLHK